METVICTDFSLSCSSDFCSSSALHTLELDIRASCLRVLNYFFKQCFLKACVCRDTTVNYSTLATLVKLLVKSSGLYGSQISIYFNVFHKTHFVLFLILLFSSYLNCHWNKCAFEAMRK